MKVLTRLMVATMAALAFNSLAYAQSTGGFPWLVKATDFVTGKQINPIGADTEKIAQEQVEYLKGLKHEVNAMLPAYSKVWYERNPKIQGGKLPQQPATSPKPPSSANNPNKGSLVGKVFVGNETLSGYGRLEFRFVSDTEVVMVDAQETVSGKWTRTGNKISLRFYSDTVVYGGTIVDDTRISGRAGNRKTIWDWNVQLY